MQLHNSCNSIKTNGKDDVINHFPSCRRRTLRRRKFIRNQLFVTENRKESGLRISQLLLISESEAGAFILKVSCYTSCIMSCSHSLSLTFFLLLLLFFLVFTSYRLWNHTLPPQGFHNKSLFQQTFTVQEVSGFTVVLCLTNTVKCICDVLFSFVCAAHRVCVCVFTETL